MEKFVPTAKVIVPWYETLVPDCIHLICLLIPEDEQESTIIAWLRVSKFFNRNQRLWRVLFSHLFPTKLEVPGRDAVLVLKKSFIEWKNHPEKKDKRTNKTFDDFRSHKVFDYYACTDMVAYAMKIRNKGMIKTLREIPMRFFDRRDMNDRALRSALIHGNIVGFEEWFNHINGVFRYTSGVDAVWINPSTHPDGTFAGIHSDDVRKMAYEGHVNSIKFLEKHVPMHALQKWLNRLDFYRLVKTHKFKTIEYLLEIGAELRFEYGSTGRQMREHPRKMSHNNNPHIVVSLLERYGDKMGLASGDCDIGGTPKAKWAWYGVTQCVRGSFLPDGYHGMEYSHPLMRTMRQKCERLFTHPFVTKILKIVQPTEDDLKLIRFLNLHVFPKHIEGIKLTAEFYYRYIDEVKLDKKIAQTMWNAMIQSVAICTNREANLKLLSTPFVTRLLDQVEITPMQIRILQERGFKIAPKCIK